MYLELPGAKQDFGGSTCLPPFWIPALPLGVVYRIRLWNLSPAETPFENFSWLRTMARRPLYWNEGIFWAPSQGVAAITNAAKALLFGIRCRAQI